MSYNVDKKTGQINFGGFEQGIAPSPHKGVANMQGVNISTETGEAMASYSRVLQSQTAGNGILTQVNSTTVSFSPSLAVGTWITILIDSGTGLSGSYYVVDTGKLSRTFAQDNTTEITGINPGTATYSVTTMGKPVQSATEYYTDTSNNPQNRYYILDNLANVWVHDSSSASVTGVAQPLWFLPQRGSTLGSFTTASGLAVLNGWLSIILDTFIYWKSTATLGVNFVNYNTPNAAGGGFGNGVNGNTLTSKFHATLTGHSGKLYYTDGIYVGSMFPTTVLAVPGENIQSFSSYSAGTISPSFIVVGGGGGGAFNGGSNGGGGGGAGGFISSSDDIIVGAYAVVVGTGGAGATVTGNVGASGVSSSLTTFFNTFTAVGGGGGGKGGGLAAPSGGSGGGGGADSTSIGTGGSGTASQGNSGGNGTTGTNRGGGGGGGANGGGTTNVAGGVGGAGITSSISGASVTYAAGGGGGGVSTGGAGGTGAGAGGFSTTPGGNASGVGCGGGGGGSSSAGGNGTNGIVIISYPTGSLTATGGTITTSGGNTIHTFTTSGTWTVSAVNSSPFQGMITAVISGAYPNNGAISPVRIPATFFTDSYGTQPSNLTVGTTYFIVNSPGSNNFTVYAAATGGSPINIGSGASGKQYFNTFNPISNGGASYLISTQIALALPTFDTATCLAELPGLILVGGISNTVYNWNGNDLSAQFIPLPENNTSNIITVNNVAYIFCGQKGNIYVTTGSSVAPVISVPDYCAGIAGNTQSYIEPYFSWGGAAYLRGRIYFSILDQTSTKSGNCGGIWSFVPTQNQFINQDKGMAMRIENQSSYGTYNGVCPVILSSQQQNVIGPQYWSAWYSDVTSPTYGIDFTGTVPVATVVIESDLMFTGTQLVPKTYAQVEYKLSSPLANGEGIAINYRLNATDSWKTCGIANVDPSGLSGYFTSNFQNTQWLQLQIVMTTSANSSSSFCRLTEIIVR